MEDPYLLRLFVISTCIKMETEGHVVSWKACLPLSRPLCTVPIVQFNGSTDSTSVHVSFSIISFELSQKTILQPSAQLCKSLLLLCVPYYAPAQCCEPSRRLTNCCSIILEFEPQITLAAYAFSCILAKRMLINEGMDLQKGTLS
eukprot:1136793-Pelagomonas_calceolata.AAC.2